jgi:hypothetical protein
MTELTGKTIANTYKQLLRVGVSTNTGVSAGLSTIETGDGTDSSFQLATGSAKFTGTLAVTGNVSLDGNIHIDDKVCASAFYGDGSNITGVTATIAGNISVSNATIGGNLYVSGTTTIVGATHLQATVSVGGAAQFGSTVTVSGATQLQSTVTVVGAATFKSTVTVEGAATFDNNVSVSGVLNVLGAATFTSKATFNDDVSVSGALDVAGNTSVGGTFMATGAATFDNNVSISGGLVVGGTVTIVGANVQAANARVCASAYHGDGSNITNISGAQISGDISVSNIKAAGNVSVGGAFYVGGTVTIAGTNIKAVNAAVCASSFYGDGSNLTNIAASIVNNRVAGNFAVSANLSVGGTSNFAGAVSLASTLSVVGAAQFNSTVTVAGNSVLASVDVTGLATAATFEPDGDTAAGDNAAIGYTAAEGLILTGQGSTSDITLKNDADATVFTVPTGTDDILFPDSAKAMFGAGSDLQIFHDGSHSAISEVGTGNLYIQSNGTQIILQPTTGESGIVIDANAAVNLYHNNIIKLATTATGIAVTGDLTGTGTVEPAGDTAAGDNAAIGYTAAEGLILTGQGSTSDITFKNDADATVMSIPTGTTNVGIGTTAPISKLQVTGATTSSGILVANSTSSLNIGSIGNHATWQGSGSSDDFVVSGYGARNLIIGTNGAERMRITSAGLVGIGTTAPSQLLDVSSTGGPLAAFSSSATNGGYAQWNRSGTAKGYIGIGGSIIVNGGADNFSIRAESSLLFSSGGASERMRITSAGNVGIGTTVPYTTTKLNVAGATSTNTTTYNATNPPAAGQLDIRSTDAYGTQLGGKLTFSGISGAAPSAVIQAVYGAIQGYKTNATINNGGGGLILSTGVNATGVLTERMRILGEGNVGIGLTAPTAKLEVAGGIKFSGQLLAGTSGSVYSPKVYAAYVAGTSMLLMRNLSGYNRIDSYNDPISATYPLAINSSFCKFNIADAEKMRLTSTGLGIGTTAPVAPLAVVGGTSNASNLSTAYSLAAFNITPKSTSGYSLQFGSGPGDKPYIQMSAGGSSANTINLQPYGGYVGIGMTGDPAAMLQVDNSSVAILAKNTNTSNLSTPALQVSKGDNNSTTSNVLVQFFMNGVAAGQGHINANGGAQAAFGSFSDRRLKENIVDLPPQLANILTLRPVEFDYIESEGGSHQIGFIAQNVQEVYPDLVGEREDGMLTLSDLNKNDARLIKAIQEQQALIEALTTRITTLEG